MAFYDSGEAWEVKLFYKRQAEEKGVGEAHIPRKGAAPLQFSHSALLVHWLRQLPEVGLLSLLPTSLSPKLERRF